MPTRREFLHAVAVSLSVALSMLCVAGCGSPTSPSPQGVRLRITNSGPAPANSLTVLFPDDQIVFGDVPAGTTTGYGNAKGVFSYAAYRLEIGGEIVTQPVIDWVGERPLEGRAFTYTINVDPRRPRFQIVQLIRVTRDE